jgi:hypothetical protein
MKLRLFAAVVCLALSTAAAHAQVGLYFNPVYNHISNSVADTGPFAFLGNNSKSNSFYGVDFGGYYDFVHSGKLAVGVDLRDSILHGNSAAINSFLFGVRVSASPFVRPFKPYAEFQVGVGTTRPPTNVRKTTREQFGALAGVDYTIAKHVDWRIAEIGYSSLTTVSSETIGGTSSIPASHIISASTGLVFRFR